MKNIDLVNNIVSKKLNIDEKIVKAVNKYFWAKGVRAKMSRLDDNAIFIRNFGTFTVSRYNTQQFIYKTIAQIRGVRRSVKFKESTKIVYLENLYKRLRLLLKARNELAKFYYNERNRRIFKADTDSSEE